MKEEEKESEEEYALLDRELYGLVQTNRQLFKKFLSVMEGEL